MSDAFVGLLLIKRCHVPDNVNLHQYRCECLKPHEHVLILKQKSLTFKNKTRHSLQPHRHYQLSSNSTWPYKQNVTAIFCCGNPQLQAAYRGVQFACCMVQPHQTHHICSPTAVAGNNSQLKLDSSLLTLKGCGS
jgi:hypothetical protein